MDVATGSDGAVKYLLEFMKRFPDKIPLNHQMRIRAALAIPKTRAEMFLRLQTLLASADPVQRFAGLTTIDRVSFFEEAQSTL